MKPEITSDKIPQNGSYCRVIAGTHKGKEGIAADMHTSKTGHVTLTLIPKDGPRFKTLARNVQLLPPTG